MTFTAMVATHLRIPGETVGQLQAEIKKLTHDEKVQLVGYARAQGIDCEEPKES